MAVAKVTTNLDEVDVKTPGSLIVAFRQNAGNKIARTLASILPNHYITKQMFLDNIPVTGQIIQAIPQNNDGHYDYNYDGSLGSNPTPLLQLRVSAPSNGWSTVGFATILDNGHIYAMADFSAATGDTYRLIIKA